jgi:phage tail sheath protein FI
MLQAELLTAVATSDTPADRIVLLDALPGRSPAAAMQAASSLAGEVPRPELGALFYPWIRILDPMAPTANNLIVPPSGHVAGVMAQTTRARGAGAPFANLALMGAVGAERLLDVSARGRLNAGQVSALREITGRGVLVFGERSLSASDPTLCFVPPSRVLAYLRRVLRVTGETLVFEPNDATLSLRILVTLDATLRQLFLGGAFAGDTPDQSYRVRCDAVTTPPDERALGRIIALVDVALAVPLEFITLRVAFSRDGAAVLDDVPIGSSLS